jgi:hypothetical protein
MQRKPRLIPTSKRNDLAKSVQRQRSPDEDTMRDTPVRLPQEPKTQEIRQRHFPAVKKTKSASCVATFDKKVLSLQLKAFYEV